MLVPLPSGIDLRFDAAPVARVVAELARESGERLAVDPEVGREIVAVRLIGKDAEAALARGLNATWTLRDGRRVLVRTVEDYVRERRACDEARLRALRSWVSSPPLPPFDAAGYANARGIVDSNDSMRDPESVRRAVEFVRTSSPEKRLALRLEAAMDPASLLVEGDESVVFHSWPNTRQRPLTPAMAQAFREYRSEFAALKGEGGAATGDPEGLEVILNADANDVRLRFRTLDARRAPLTGDQTDGSDESFGFAAELREGGPEKRLVARDPWGLGEESRIPAPVWSRLLDVAHVDPLEPVGAWLARCAGARREGLVAVLGDEILNRLPYGLEEPGRYLKGLTVAGYAASEDGGLLWIAPINRARARARQVDREALAEWLAQERAGRPLSLADRLRLTRRLPLAGDAWGMIDWLTSVGVVDPAWNTPLVRIAGRLPRGTFAFSNLAPDVAATLGDMVLRAGPADLRTRLDWVCGTGWEVADDVTDELPDGIPPGATVRVEEFRVPCYIDLRAPRRELSLMRAMTVEALDGESDLYAPDALRVGSCHRIDLTVDLGHGRAYQDRVEAVEGLGPPISPTALPEPLASAFRRAETRSAAKPY